MTNAFIPNSLAWFEVATDDPDTAASFYADATERLGGKVVSKELTPPVGPAFAYLRDPVGSLFGVFTPVG